MSSRVARRGAHDHLLRGLTLALVAALGTSAVQCHRADETLVDCLEPRVRCGGSCADLAVDPNNCGQCGNACAADEVCSSGRCTSGCAPGCSGGGELAAGGAGGAGTALARFTVAATLSPMIGTVGIVDWSVDAPIESAYIDFGRDPADWEYRAPVVAPVAGENRTLLLGMKPSSTYAFQIRAEGGGTTFSSDVYQITTDAVRNGLPRLSVATAAADLVSPGFTISCGYGEASLEGSWITILDEDGEYVWWYRTSEVPNCSRVRMSYDGGFMWAGNANVRGGIGRLVRVRMDGSAEEIFVVPSRHHDFVVMPDETVVTIEFETADSRGCDVVTAFDPVTETSRMLYQVQAADSNFVGTCHSNAINWWPDQELFTLSVLNWNSILAFTDAGELKWILGGERSDFAGAEWSRQHQHQLVGDRILIFNNEGTAGGADVLEYQFAGDTASLSFRLASPTSTLAFGDVKRLPNDNLLVTYSNSGVIREMTPSQDVVREIATVPIGYTVRRTSLYGPPPPFGG